MHDDIKLRIVAEKGAAVAAAVRPTTKILAIGSVTAQGTPDGWPQSDLVRRAIQSALLEEPAQRQCGTYVRVREGYAP